MAIRQRLRSLLWRVPVDQEVRDELAHHLELRTQELIRRGLTPADARAEAERRLEAGRDSLVACDDDRSRHCVAGLALRFGTFTLQSEP